MEESSNTEMGILITLKALANQELAELRRSGAGAYAVRSEAVRNFLDRMKNYFIAHPESACGIFGTGLELPSAQFNAVLEKCSNALLSEDDPRFSLYDLMDAVGHAPFALDITRLLALNDEDFYKVATAMADAKRRTYCSGFEAAPDAYPTADDLEGLVRQYDLKEA